MKKTRRKRAKGGTSKRLVESAELAEALGVDRSVVYRWARAGMPVAERQSRRNFYDVDACRAWAQKHHGLGEKPAPTSSTSNSDKGAVEDLRGEGLRDELTRARVEKERELARIQRARAEREEGSQIPIAEVRRLVADLFGLVRARLEAAPSQLAETLAPITEPLLIQSEMREWVRLVQGDLHQALLDYIDAT